MSFHWFLWLSGLNLKYGCEKYFLRQISMFQRACDVCKNSCGWSENFKFLILKELIFVEYIDNQFESCVYRFSTKI